MWIFSLLFGSESDPPARRSINIRVYSEVQLCSGEAKVALKVLSRGSGVGKVWGVTDYPAHTAHNHPTATPVKSLSFPHLCFLAYATWNIRRYSANPINVIKMITKPELKIAREEQYISANRNEWDINYFSERVSTRCKASHVRHVLSFLFYFKYYCMNNAENHFVFCTAYNFNRLYGKLTRNRINFYRENSVTLSIIMIIIMVLIYDPLLYYWI